MLEKPVSFEKLPLKQIKHKLVYLPLFIGMGLRTAQMFGMQMWGPAFLHSHLRLVAFTGGRIYVSHADLQEWSQSTSGLPDNSEILALGVSGDGRTLVCGR